MSPKGDLIRSAFRVLLFDESSVVAIVLKIVVILPLSYSLTLAPFLALPLHLSIAIYLALTWHLSKHRNLPPLRFVYQDNTYFSQQKVSPVWDKEITQSVSQF